MTTGCSFPAGDPKPLSGKADYGEMGKVTSNGGGFGGPTVHNGWTSEPARRSESDARINRARSALRADMAYAPYVK